MMTLEMRVEAFRQANRDNPACWPWLTSEKGLPVVYGVKCIGQDYRSTGAIYGSYPPGVVRWVLDLFPDVVAAAANSQDGWIRHPLMHAFSGSMPPGRYFRVDCRPEPSRGVSPDLVADVCDLPRLLDDLGCGDHRYDLIMADPPYSPEDAAKYGVKMVDRRKALCALAKVTKPGGFIAWLDVQWPMHRLELVRTAGRLWIDPRPEGDEWPVESLVRTAGEIGVQRSTNHDLRALYLFERRAA